MNMENLNKKILTLNVGSSSCKYQIFTNDFEEIGRGLIEKIGIPGTTIRFSSKNLNIKEKRNLVFTELDSFLIDFLTINKIVDFSKVYLMSHRVVNGGDVFKDNFLIENEEIIAKLESLNHLAPLHNPFNISMLKSMYQKLPNVKHVVIFDTSFHSTIPKENYLYALPYEFYEKYKIRKYGAHGSSHAYVTKTMEEYLQKKVNIINVHMGNGSSICVTKDSKSINTSMGFTPLAGVVMGTRTGDIDPSIPLYMINQLKIDPIETENILVKKSGLLGISKISSDMREIIKAEKQGNEHAILARNIGAKRVVDVIAAYLSEINYVDAITFTGGIGENDFSYIKLIFSKLKNYKISLIDNINNSQKVNLISKKDSQIKVYIVPTNEELYMAKVGKKLIEELN